MSALPRQRGVSLTIWVNSLVKTLCISHSRLLVEKTLQKLSAFVCLTATVVNSLSVDHQQHVDSVGEETYGTWANVRSTYSASRQLQFHQPVLAENFFCTQMQYVRVRRYENAQQTCTAECHWRLHRFPNASATSLLSFRNEAGLQSRSIRSTTNYQNKIILRGSIMRQEALAV